MLTLEEIQAGVRERLEYVRPMVAEYELLTRALEALGGPVAVEEPAAAPVDAEAPYGRKADGTPRKRAGRRSSATLRVQTAGVPAVKDGAEPAYATQEG